MNFAELGVKYLRIRAKSSGPMRLAILNTLTDEYKKKHKDEEGAEPGIGIWTSSDYTTTIYDLTPCGMGFLGRGKDCSSSDPDSLIDIFPWVDYNTAPEGTEILKSITGLKWSVRDPRGGTGEISIMSVEFLDAAQNVIDAVMLTGVAGVRSVIELESSSSEEPESSSSEEPESSSSEEPASSSSEEVESSSSEEIASSSSEEPESSSSEEPESSSSVEPESSSSEEPESSSSVEPESSSSEEPESSSSAEPKSSSSKTTKSSSSVAPKSSSSSKAKSSSSVAPKSSSSKAKSSSSSKKAKSSSSSAPKSSSSSKKKDALPLQHAASTIHVAVSGMQLMISNATLGSDYAVFTMQGKVITAGKIQRGTESVTLQNQGAYLVRVGHEVFKVNRL